MSLGLKSLELQGYKTFANRTVFEFSENITAIVGPNGSGKSNIADSIRWVLGEQSFNVLRGRKTEDMIFSGSEKRSRSGMASATITFNNSNGWLPIEFTEVAITRRAYRDGQNEYLINGKRTRLKDVSELLSQSGLAERTYTIIGQGLVDAALSLKAEERRRLFEEAAGIGLYRSRREEALRRLDTTRRNLDRVQDIILELEPRLKSLERQAKRAKEYDQVRDDLQLILREWYGYHWNSLQEEYSRAIVYANEQEQFLNQIKLSQQNIDTTSLNEQEKIFSLRKDINHLHKKSAEFHLESQSLSRNMAIIDERMVNFRQQMQRVKDDLIQFEVDLENAKNQRASLDKEVSKKQQILDEANAQLDAIRPKLNQLIHDYQIKEDEILRLKNEVESLFLKRGMQQAKIQEHTVQLDEYTQKKDTLETRRSDLESDQINITKKLTALEEILNEKRDLISESLSKINDFTNELEIKHNKIESMRADLFRLDEEQESLETRINILNNADERYHGYTTGAKVLLEEQSRFNNQEIIGTVNSFITLPEYLETAITAALGEFLDAVIVKEAGQRSLSLLINNQVRGILLPIGLIQSNQQDVFSDYLEKSGVLGIASNFVNVPGEISIIINFLLGSALLVEDKLIAQNIHKEIAAKENLQDRNSLNSLRIVTLQGEIFFLSGPIISGSKVGGTDQVSLISRNRKRQEYQNRIHEIQSNISHIQASIDQLIPEEKNLDHKISREQTLFEDLNSEYESLEKQVSDAKTELERNKDSIDWNAQEQIIIEKLTADLSEEISQLKSDLNQINQELSEKQDRYKSDKLNESLLIIDEYKNSVAHWEKMIALTDQSREEIRHRIDDKDKIILANIERIENLKQQIVTIIDQEDTNERERTIIRSRELEYEERIKEIQIEIDQAETNLDQLEKGQLERQHKQTESRKKLSKAEHQYAQARIELASKREAIESLRRRIEEDMGLVNLDYSDSVSGPTPLPLDGFVKDLPVINTLAPDMEISLNRHRALLRRIGPINPEALVEYREVRERFQFLSEQMTDLQLAENDIRQVIDELDLLMEQEFLKTFESVATEFSNIFSKLFNGGSAQLLLTDPDNFNNAGIDIEARLPGRRPQRLSLLSGGERSLTATALIFALLRVSPTPFCLLDEVDAMLDEANLDRFREMLSELSRNTQFVVVTHNRNTVQAADMIYGVTMGVDSASQVVSLKPGELINPN